MELNGDHVVPRDGAAELHAVGGGARHQGAELRVGVVAVHEVEPVTIRNVALQKKVPYISEDGKAAFRTEINDCPMPMDVFEADDIVVLVGSEKNFNKLFAELAD